MKTTEGNLSMTGEEFVEWRKSLGINRLQASELLGISRNTITRNEKGLTPIPDYVALACAALACGLEPWKSGDEDFAEAVRNYADRKRKVTSVVAA
jgi:transcriptional regulator with XRE-family HTH domain